MATAGLSCGGSSTSSKGDFRRRTCNPSSVIVGHHRQGMISRWLYSSVAQALNDKLGCSLSAACNDVSNAELFAAASAVL